MEPIDTVDGTVPESVYKLNDVVKGSEPVSTLIDVPLAVLSFSFTRGNIVPALAVFLSHNVRLTVPPAVITPDALGTPLCVSNSLITYSPFAAFFRFADCTASFAASGPADFICNMLPDEASRWRWYVTD